MRGVLFLLGMMLMAAGACAPGSTHCLTPGVREDASDEPGREQSNVDKPASGEGVVDRSGAEESELDVWITFTGKDWDDVWNDWLTGRTTDTVIARLRKYKVEPETYFATLPKCPTRCLPWRTRIKIEIGLHRIIGDNDIHFSEWWISKDRWPVDCCGHPVR
jgi:hypothetical protein